MSCTPSRALRPLVAAALACAVLPAVAAAQVPNPTVEGPIGSPAGAFIQAAGFDLGEAGYTQAEYFIEGTASGYTNVGPLGEDGIWDVTPGGTAPYKTRIMVYRPSRPRKFNGTVVVEWLNVSGGVDAAPDWIQGHTELIREGYAWVGVSAQYVGVEGGPGLVNVISLPLKTVNPGRYGTLHHPRDAFSYDIFSQAAQAVRRPVGVDPLDGLKVKRMIAAGESQSAFRLVTYINALHPLVHLFDGYLVHSRGSILGGALSESPLPAIGVPGTARIRSDLDVPVLTLETESDLTFLGYHAARQEDTDRFRLWEVAGTSHADAYFVLGGPADRGNSPSVFDLVVTASPLPGVIDCGLPINSGPQHIVVRAAFAALNRWIKRGKPPKPVPRLEVSGSPVAIMRDEHGNALGGARTPAVDVPIATFTGEQDGSILCRLFGTTTPFDATKLASLYPSHRAFVSAYVKALKRAVAAGVVVKADARLMRKWAARSSIGR
jgi:hypothetical protein